MKTLKLASYESERAEDLTKVMFCSGKTASQSQRPRLALKILYSSAEYIVHITYTSIVGFTRRKLRIFRSFCGHFSKNFAAYCNTRNYSDYLRPKNHHVGREVLT